MSQSRILYTPRERKQKQKKFSREKLWIIFAVAGFLVFFVLCVVVVRLSYFQIRDIAVNEIPGDAGALGTEQDNLDIRNALDTMLSGNYALVIPRRFVFAMSGSAMEDRLLAGFPRFEKIVVAKKIPHGLSVSYAKRIFFALLCNEASRTDVSYCGYIDRTGFVYADAPEASGSLIVKIKSDLADIKVGTRAIEEQTVKQMALFGDGMQSIAGLRLTSYELSTQAPDELRIRTADGFTLIVKKDGNPESILRILRTVLDQEIKDNKSKLDYIDLRLGNKVFYKYKLR